MHTEGQSKDLLMDGFCPFNQVFPLSSNEEKKSREIWHDL
jgi:hypothetical protein